MKIGGYGSIATSSAVAAVRKPTTGEEYTSDMERVQDSAADRPAMPITFPRTFEGDIL